MAEGRRKPYRRPNIVERGRITEETLQSIYGSREKGEVESSSTGEGAERSRDPSEREGP